MTEQLKKWFSGIAVTVIGGLILWYLTKPVDSPKPLPTVYADAKIVDCNVPIISIGFRAMGTFTVYNDGNAVAEDCEIWWSSGTEAGIYTVSEKFSLLPKQKLSIKMRSGLYSKAGKFSSMLHVIYKYNTPAEANTRKSSGDFLCDVIVK